MKKHQFYNVQTGPDIMPQWTVPRRKQSLMLVLLKDQLLGDFPTRGQRQQRCTQTI